MNTSIYTTSENTLPPYIEDVKQAALRNGLETLVDIDTFKHEDVPAVLKKYPEVNFVGVGIEAVVIGDPENPDRVLSYEYRGDERDPYYFLEIYQMHKILNILYPSHFPRIYGVDHKQAMTMRKRVNYEGKEQYIDLFKHDGYPERLEEHIKDTSSLRVHLDYNAKNFIKDKEGKYKYVDLVEIAENTAAKLDMDKALAYFDKKFESKLQTERGQIQRERLIHAIEKLKEIDEIKKKRKIKSISQVITH